MRGTGTGRHHWVQPLRGTGGPSDRALHRLVGWYAVGFRLWIAVAVVVAAPLAATAAVSGAWLAAALVTLCAWSAFFAVRVGRRGITVAHPADARYLVFQALATAALMVLVRRGGRNADAAIRRQLRLEQDLKVEAARLADQREQDRRLHDTILSTLTMVASGALDRSSPVLAAQASRDLQVLHALPASPGPAPRAAMALRDRLAAVAAEAGPLRVSASFFSATKTLPATAVDRLADCAAEALRNVARHAGTDAAEIQVRDANGQVVGTGPAETLRGPSEDAAKTARGPR